MLSHIYKVISVVVDLLRHVLRKFHTSAVHAFVVSSHCFGQKFTDITRNFSVSIGGFAMQTP
ncbi:hypothetical protein D2E26_0896 [Bifidobacterium dolichotidis]|uniref:Uncharacterized protein n=1 Tax=Bifidobacterium dolichotidis TaxID=2306976 RepID=A0A430FPS6_9BIFI|nr:hypothetical protein D2E26_0896 [Bifidobacterium dolichotidis]